MTRAAVLLLFATRLALAAPFVVTDDDNRWQIDLPEGWAAAILPEVTEGKALAAFTLGRMRLVMVRLRGNTDGAYDGKTGFFAGLEAGVAKEAPAYKRLGATQRKLGSGKKKKLPAYDLWYRTGGDVRGIRFIFMKNYSILMSLELTGTAGVSKDARRILESFGPAPAPPASP